MKVTLIYDEQQTVSNYVLDVFGITAKELEEI